MAEGRGGVAKLSFTTDWVPNLQRSRGMKRRRFYNPKTSKDYRRKLRRNKELGIRVMRFENRAVSASLDLVLKSIRIELQETGRGTGIACIA